MEMDYISTLQSADAPIYIFGGGEVGNLIKRKLLENNIQIKGFVVDDNKCKEEFFNKNDVIKEEAYYLVKGFLQAYYLSNEEILDSWIGCKGIITIYDVYEPYIVEKLDKYFYTEHKIDFDKVRNAMTDDLSKLSLDSYLETKLTLNGRGLISLVQPIQYFFKDAPWKYSANDVLIDGGAFNGDSIDDFLLLRGEAYQKIIAFEPDAINYSILCNKFENNEKVQVVNKGLYSKTTVLSFSAEGTMESSLSECGDVKIEVVSIDELVEENNVSIIKLDVEGSEMDVLYGAANTIKRDRPILMISAYHKEADLIDIFNFINNLVDNYTFYFRCHKPMAIDAVLYAVPSERNLG